MQSTTHRISVSMLNENPEKANNLSYTKPPRLPLHKQQAPKSGKIPRVNRLDDEEMKRKEFEKSVLDNYEKSTRSSSISSWKSKGVQRLAQQSIAKSRDVISTFNEEVKQFDGEMKKVIKQEEIRIEKEEDLKEKIRQNAGKRLDFF